MSTITVGGWGAQGGLITLGGWGGAFADRPALPARYRPRIARSLELAPDIVAKQNPPPMALSALELRPQAQAADASILPRQDTEELRPSVVQASSLSASSIFPEELKPQLTSAARPEKIPNTDAKEMKPQIGCKPQTSPEHPSGHALRPKITDGEGD